MKKLLLMLFLLFSFLLLKGQTNNEDYPKLLINNKDTFLILTVDQVKKLNILKEEKNKYETLTDSLSLQMMDYDLVIIKDKELIDNLKEQLILKDNILTEKDGIISEYIEKDKKLSKKLKLNMFFNKMLIGGVIVLGVLVLL